MFIYSNFIRRILNLSDLINFVRQKVLDKTFNFVELDKSFFLCSDLKWNEKKIEFRYSH